eukprot:810950-Prymnesium_polylepis.1
MLYASDYHGTTDPIAEDPDDIHRTRTHAERTSYQRATAARGESQRPEPTRTSSADHAQPPEPVSADEVPADARQLHGSHTTFDRNGHAWFENSVRSPEYERATASGVHTGAAAAESPKPVDGEEDGLCPVRVTTTRFVNAHSIWAPRVR